MSQIPALISDLAVILISAGLVTLLFKKLKQPVVLGYKDTDLPSSKYRQLQMWKVSVSGLI